MFESNSRFNTVHPIKYLNLIEMGSTPPLPAPLFTRCYAGSLGASKASLSLATPAFFAGDKQVNRCNSHLNVKNAGLFPNKSGAFSAGTKPTLGQG